MKSTRDLIDLIKNDKIEELQIDNQLAGSINKIKELRDIMSQSLDFHVIPSDDDKNKILFITSGSKEVEVKYSYGHIRKQIANLNLMVWDIGDNKKISEHSIAFPGRSTDKYITSVINPEANTLIIGHGGSYPACSVIDLKTMTYQKNLSYFGHHGVQMNLSESNGNILISSGDRYVDIFSKKGEPYELDVYDYDRWKKWPTHRFDLGGEVKSIAFNNNHHIFSIDSRRFDGSTKENALRHHFQGSKIFIPGEYDKILKLVQNGSHETLFCSKIDGSLGMVQTGVFSSGHKFPIDNILSDIQFDSLNEERVNNIHVLEYKKNSYPDSILAETYEKKSENHYVYHFNLNPREKLGKINLGRYNTRGRLTDGRFIFRSDDVLATLSLHQVMSASELNEVLHALKSNTSVKVVSLMNQLFSRESIEHLVQLKQNRPTLVLQLPRDMEDYLNLPSQLENIRKEKQTAEDKIVQLTSDISHQIQENKEFHLKLMQFEKKNEDLKKEISELQNVNSSKVKELTNQFNDQIKINSELKEMMAMRNKKYQEAITASQEEIEKLQDKISAISREYEDTLILFSLPQMPLKSLDVQLNEAKELKPDLMMQLVDPGQNIEGLSLIRWSEQDNLENLKEDLIKRGIILTVPDLLHQIQKIKPPHNEKRKIDRLINAVEKLMLDYEEKSLPPSAMNCLVDLIVPEIEREIKYGQPVWLKKLYNTKIIEIKNNIKSEYFLRKPHEAVPSLDAQFKQVVDEILRDNDCDIYHEYLANPEILDKIRKRDNDDITFNQLVEMIQNKINAIKIELNTSHHEEAMRTLLKKPTENINKLFHDKIIQYGEKLKEKLSPEAAEIRSLKAQILELQEKLEYKPLSNPESPRVTTTAETLFGAPLAQSLGQESTKAVSTSSPTNGTVSSR